MHEASNGNAKEKDMLEERDEGKCKQEARNKVGKIQKLAVGNPKSEIVCFRSAAETPKPTETFVNFAKITTSGPIFCTIFDEKAPFASGAWPWPFVGWT